MADTPSSRNGEENWQRLVKRLRDMRAYGGQDYSCMDDAADMIERLTGHVERLLASAPSERGRTAELRYLLESTAKDGQWADQAVHSYVKTMLRIK